MKDQILKFVPIKFYAVEKPNSLPIKFYAVEKPKLLALKFYAVEKPNLLLTYPLDSMLLKNHFKIQKFFRTK